MVTRGSSSVAGGDACRVVQRSVAMVDMRRAGVLVVGRSLRTFRVRGMQRTVPVDHMIQAFGVILEIGGQSNVFTGDAGPTSSIWKRTNATSNVVTVVTEASFPLADESAHLT